MQSLMNREPAPCTLVRLACERCGPVRMALPSPVSDELESHECPYCDGGCKIERLGLGQTARLLPYFELESNLKQIQPLSTPNFRRLVQGQVVIFCEEMSILHYATVGEIWTNAINLSPSGVPSISFMIRGIQTDPIPHISGAGGNPPFWCFPEDLREAARSAAADLAAKRPTILPKARKPKARKIQ